MVASSSFAPIIDKVIKFREERDWKQSHSPKNLAIGLSVESSELLELFLWKDATEVDDWLNTNAGRERLQKELADVLIYLLYISHDLKVDLFAAVESKLKKNHAKHPVKKSRASSRKYNDLDS
jgi:NTP pyrophosphatase (non-canonical NTP hydrolase)